MFELKGLAMTDQSTTFVPSPQPTGWICPRCGAVNAPDVKQCSCSPSYYPFPYYPQPYCPPYFPYWTGSPVVTYKVTMAGSVLDRKEG